MAKVRIEVERKKASKRYNSRIITRDFNIGDLV